jgi:hypothetical protein
MESAATFARAENIRVAVHDLGFVCLELMEGFFTFNHANFALHGTRRLHASNSIPLPENRRFHDLFELPTGVIAIGGIIIMLGKWDGKSVSLGVASRSTPVRTKVFSTRLDDLPHISYVLAGSLLQVALHFTNIINTTQLSLKVVNNYTPVATSIVKAFPILTYNVVVLQLCGLSISSPPKTSAMILEVRSMFNFSPKLKKLWCDMEILSQVRPYLSCRCLSLLHRGTPQIFVAFSWPLQLY